MNFCLKQAHLIASVVNSEKGKKPVKMFKKCPDCVGVTTQMNGLTFMSFGLSLGK